MQFRNFSFGVDSVSFEDSTKEVYGLRDVTKASLNCEFEKTEKRGGKNNEVRAVGIHTRNAELVIETGYADTKLSNLLSGGTITSLGTSAASITTAMNTLYGTTTKILTAITSTTVISPTLVKSDKYYVEALSFTAIKVSRVSDGSVINTYTLSANGTITLAGEGIVMLAAATGIDSLTSGEKTYFESRSAINSFNQTFAFDGTKASPLACNITVDFNGVRQRLTIPNVQPTGEMVDFSSTEFRVKSLKIPVYLDDTTNILAQSQMTA